MKAENLAKTNPTISQIDSRMPIARSVIPQSNQSEAELMIKRGADALENVLFLKKKH